MKVLDKDGTNKEWLYVHPWNLGDKTTQAIKHFIRFYSGEGGCLDLKH